MYAGYDVLRKQRRVVEKPRRLKERIVGGPTYQAFATTTLNQPVLRKNESHLKRRAVNNSWASTRQPTERFSKNICLVLPSQRVTRTRPRSYHNVVHESRVEDARHVVATRPAPTVIDSGVDWLEACHPTKVTDFIGRGCEIQFISAWLTDFDTTPIPLKPICLLSGGTGLGKTSLVHTLLRAEKYQIVEINASDTRGYKEMYSIMSKVCLKVSLRGKTALVLDEIDTVSDCGKGCIAAILDFFGANDKVRAKSPVVCICNSTHKVRKLFKYAKQVKFGPLADSSLLQIFTAITTKMNVVVGATCRQEVLQKADGDVRQMVQTLRLMSPERTTTGAIDRCMNMFIATQCFFTPRCNALKLEQSISVLRSTGHMAGGLVFENYTRLENCASPDPVAQMNAISDFADQITIYDEFNNWQYKTVLEDDGIAHTFLGLSAQQFVKSRNHRSLPTITSCKRSFFEQQHSYAVIVDESGSPRFQQQCDAGYVDLINKH